MSVEKPAHNDSNCLLLNHFRNFFADDLKLLRVAMSSFFDMLIVCAKTLMEFDDTTQSIP